MYYMRYLKRLKKFEWKVAIKIIKEQVHNTIRVAHLEDKMITYNIVTINAQELGPSIDENIEIKEIN